MLGRLGTLRNNVTVRTRGTQPAKVYVKAFKTAEGTGKNHDFLQRTGAVLAGALVRMVTFG